MLSLDLDDPDAVPYFAWDRPVTNAELRALLAGGSEDDRLVWAARILREARVPDVWRYLDLRRDVLPRWAALRPLLGRRGPMWDYLIDGWTRDGLL
jgi:hypothetical protein